MNNMCVVIYCVFKKLILTNLFRKIADFSLFTQKASIFLAMNHVFAPLQKLTVLLNLSKKNDVVAITPFLKARGVSSIALVASVLSEAVVPVLLDMCNVCTQAVVTDVDTFNFTVGGA